MYAPNLNALRMFDAAARHLNFRLAAEELNLTQGAVAQQVRRLEADLGQRLFDRKARGLALTETGRTYHGPVARALALIDQATQAIRPAPRRITLSVPPSLASKWLVPRLEAFERLHAETDLRTIATEQVSRFGEDGVDIAIRQGRVRRTGGLITTPLAPLDLVAVADPATARRLGPVIKLADLADQRLIRDGHGHWQAVFDAAGLPVPDRFLSFNQSGLAIDAAMAGRGIALVPRLLAAQALVEGGLIALWRPPPSGDDGFHIAHPRTAAPSPARDAVIAWLLAEAEGG